FLEEAREVVGNGLAAIDALAENAADISELTTLRRAFHTLKGSSRMVGLTEFGEAAWSLEQVLNTCLADQKPASESLRTLASQAMRGFALWVDDIAAQAAPELPTEPVPHIPVEPPSDYVAAFGSTQTFHLEPGDIEPPQPAE